MIARLWHGWTTAENAPAYQALVTGEIIPRIGGLTGSGGYGGAYVLRRDTPDEIVLAVNADQEVRLARDEIASLEPSAVSVMPAGLDQQLTPRELVDLVAFLKACK